MAFPQVASSSTSNNNTALTTQAVTMPSGINSGDLLVMIVRFSNAQGVGNVTASGWTNETPLENRLFVFSRTADGTEGASVNISNDVSDRTTHIALRITGWNALELDVTSGDDPPSLSPSWGSDDNLFIAVTSARTSDWTYSAAPANYSDLIDSGHPSSSSTTRSRVAAAFRELAASSDDPGVFTKSGGSPDANLSATIAIQSGATPASVTLDTSTVTVASVSGGVPPQLASLFEDCVVLGDANQTGTITVADATKCDLATPLPSGWTDDGGGIYTCTSRTAAQMQADLRSMIVEGASTGSTTIEIEVDDGTTTDTGTVTVNVVDPDLTVPYASGSTYDLGSVMVGVESTVQFTILNNGAVSLTLGTLSISGTGYSISAGDNPSSAVIAPGASDTVTVALTAVAAGTVTGTLTIPSDDPASPYTIDLTASATGSGPGAFALLTPADTATGVSLTPTLAWEESADAVSYTVYIDPAGGTAGAGAVWISADIVDGQTVTVTEGVLEHDTEYVWRVVAEDAGAGTTDCTADFTFTTLSAPTLLARSRQRTRRAIALRG